MQTKIKQEAEMWFACLAFLTKQKVREQTNQEQSSGSSYFHTLKNTMMLQNNEANTQLNEEPKDKKLKKLRSKSQAGNVNQHKFSNITAKAFISVLNEDPTMKTGTMKEPTQQSLSEKALQTKGLWNYLKTIKQTTLKSRLMYGFLKKRGKGKMKSF